MSNSDHFYNRLEAVKYQVFHCYNPSQMYLIMLNHFEALEDMFVNIDPGMRNRVRNYFTNIIAPRFTPLPMLQWAKLRRQILNDYEVNLYLLQRKFLGRLRLVVGQF